MRSDRETIDIAATIINRHAFGASHMQVAQIVGAVLDEQEERKRLAEHLAFMDRVALQKRELWEMKNNDD